MPAEVLCRTIISWSCVSSGYISLHVSLYSLVGCLRMWIASLSGSRSQLCTRDDHSGCAPCHVYWGIDGADLGLEKSIFRSPLNHRRPNILFKCTLITYHGINQPPLPLCDAKW